MMKEEEEEEEDVDEEIDRLLKKPKGLSQLSIGDITITARKDIPVLKKELVGLLKEKQIRRYLGVYQKKKSMIPNYID